MERWWGFRPCTPDQNPIIGKSLLKGLLLATGHHRNGVLLAAITSQLISDYLLGNKLSLEFQTGQEMFQLNSVKM